MQSSFQGFIYLFLINHCNSLKSLIFEAILKYCQLPKKERNPSPPNDYRPVAFTFLVIKSFEKIVRKEILALTNSALDHLQFAYRSGRGVEDATCILLNMISRHLEGTKSHAR